MIRIRPKNRLQMRSILIVSAPLLVVYALVDGVYKGLREACRDIRRDIPYLWNTKKFDR